MTKNIVILLLLLIGITSCNKADKEIDKLQIAKDFYKSLDHSDHAKLTQLISEEFTTIDDGFEQQYNKESFTNWVEWDSVFEPTYKILRIQEENGLIKAEISKTDQRISFLHQNPIQTEELLQFEDGRIKSIDRISISFDVERFVKNRDEFVQWIKENHPELDGFLYDQTQRGGKNYLTAIELYEARLLSPNK